MFIRTLSWSRDIASVSAIGHARDKARDDRRL
jgi:hypothetical protein